MPDSLGTFGRVRCTVLRPGADRVLIGEEHDRAVRDGLAWVDFDRHHNLIVNTGLQAIAKFLGNNAGAPSVGGATFASLEDLTIGSMELGVAAVPVLPAVGDTVGVSSLVYTPPLTVSYPTDYSVMFSGLLPIGEANGQTITEEAIRMRGGKLFARTTFSRAKTSAFALQFDHTISFARI